MNALKDLRTRITTVLEQAGISVYDHVPARLTPPAAVITPDVPYIEQGDTFGLWKINLVVTLIARTATNTVATDAIDTDLLTALPALDALVNVTRVGPYYRYSANATDYLALDINIFDTNDLKEV